MALQTRPNNLSRPICRGPKNQRLLWVFWHDCVKTCFTRRFLNRVKSYDRWLNSSSVNMISLNIGLVLWAVVNLSLSRVNEFYAFIKHIKRAVTKRRCHLKQVSQQDWDYDKTLLNGHLFFEKNYYLSNLFGI